jgi:hypothetical protein
MLLDSASSFSTRFHMQAHNVLSYLCQSCVCAATCCCCRLELGPVGEHDQSWTRKRTWHRGRTTFFSSRPALGRERDWGAWPSVEDRAVLSPQPPTQSDSATSGGCRSAGSEHRRQGGGRER